VPGVKDAMHPNVIVELNRKSARYAPGETIAGSYRLQSLPKEDVQSVEMSVMWYTIGKGDEDLHIQHFDELTFHQLRLMNLLEPRPFSVTLPKSPASYDGVIVTIRWCIRLRYRLHGDKEILHDESFTVGEAQPGQEVPKEKRGTGLPVGQPKFT